MRRRVLSLLLALTLCLGLAVPTLAASDEAVAAADRLNGLGLFNGVGNNADGTPNYDLDRAPTRMEAVTLLVRLLGKGAEAEAGSWTTPFTDVADWAKPYVGYAYTNDLTAGTSATTFSGTDTVSATQYLTFVLRAMGYTSGTDFQWDKAWELTDKLGITAGQYGAASAFTRGDAVLVSSNALDVKLKDGSKTLLAAIEESLANAPEVPPAPVGNTGKVFTCTGYAAANDLSDLWDQGYDGKDKAKASVEVISSSEAVFTLEYPFAMSEAWSYYITFESGDDSKYHQFQFSYHSIENSFNAYESVYSEAPHHYSFEKLEGAVFTETGAEDYKITWRVKLPADCPFTFDMIGEYEMICGVSADYG